MNNLRDDEPAILAQLMPDVERLQNDSRGLMQWIVTLNDQERRYLHGLSAGFITWHCA
jgi:hypothetical protein